MTHWSNWGIFQPTKFKIIDFAGDNGHADSTTGRNSAEDETSFPGTADGSEITYEVSMTFEVEDLGYPKFQQILDVFSGLQSEEQVPILRA